MKTEAIGDEIVITLEKLINLCLDYGLVADEKRRQTCYELLKTTVENEIKKGLKQNYCLVAPMKDGSKRTRKLFEEKWGKVGKCKHRS